MFKSEEVKQLVKPNSRRRVLKPPGGGSSDIFGVSAEPAEPQRKIRSHLTSSIFGEETVTPSRHKADNPVASEVSKVEPAAVNGAASSTSSSATSSSAPTPSAPTPAAGKQRVPPGGFSSGLW